MKIKALAVSFTVVLAISFCSSGPEKMVLRKIPREKRQGLMVLNFKNNTLKNSAAEYKPWEFGLASMVMTDIESIGLFNIVSREMLKKIISEQEFQLTGFVDPDKAVKIGKIVAAKYVLAGSFMEMKGSLRIESQVISVETGAQLGAASVTGKTDNFFNLEKQLVIKVTKFLNAALTAQEQAMLAKNVETKSVKASLSNYRGELDYLKAMLLKDKGLSDESKRLLKKAKSNFKTALMFDPEYERAKENLSKISLAIPVTL